MTKKVYTHSVVMCDSCERLAFIKMTATARSWVAKSCSVCNDGVYREEELESDVSTKGLRLWEVGMLVRRLIEERLCV